VSARFGRRHSSVFGVDCRRAIAPVVAVALSLSSLAVLDVAAPVSAARAETVPAGDVTERPDQVSAALAARLAGHRVEVTSARTESTSTFVNPDGTLTTETFAGPVRTDKDGELVPVDTTLESTDEGVSPVAVPGEVTFSDGGDVHAATVAGDRGSFGFDWPTSLPEPVLDGDTAVYPNVADGVDLVVQALRQGFELSLRLTRRPTEPLTLRLPVTATRWTVEQQPDGSLRLVNRSGDVAASADAPVMFDATTDAHSGNPVHVQAVESTLEGTADNPVLVLRPDEAFLADPATTFPVTIDPATSLSDSADTWVESDYTSSQYSSTELRAGTYNAGSVKARSYLRFGIGPVQGKHVLSATLKLYETHSFSCSARKVEVVRLQSPFSSSTTWANKPDMGVVRGSATFAAGYSSSCPNAWESIILDDIVQKWADGTYDNDGLAVRAADETDSYGWKKFNSGNADSKVPYLSVTYNSYPKTPTSLSTSPTVACTTGSGRPWLNTKTPTLKATVDDVDGGSLQASFYVKVVGGSQIGGGERLGSSVSHGSVSSTALPSGWGLASGTSYSWRARAYDGTDYSAAYGGWCEFTVDTVAPTVGTITSNAFVNGEWTETKSGTLSWTGSDTLALAGYQTKLDTGAWSALSSATSKTLSNLANGVHVFSVQAKDKAGNLSTIQSFWFGVGTGYALTSPADQDRTQARVMLAGAALSGHDYVWYKYRHGTTGSWVDVPTVDVTVPGTQTSPSKPVVRGGDGSFPQLEWNVADTVAGDGVVQVEACFFTSPTDTNPVCSPSNDVEVVAHAFGETFAAEDVGPGAVSLLTGDYAVSAADVAASTPTGSLSVGRTLTTLAPPAASSGALGVFGPGWTADLPGVDAGAGDTQIADHTADGYVLLAYPDGGTELYLAGAVDTNGDTPYIGQGDAGADASTLTQYPAGHNTGESTAAHFTLVDDAGTKTIWTGGNASTPWQVAKVIEPGIGSTSFAYASGRVTRITAPAATGIDCGPAPLMTPGCRSLSFTYAASTANGLSDTTWGDYLNRLISVNLVTADVNDLTGASMTTPIELAHYAYDNLGRLRAAWDPRLAAAGQPLLKTTYSYNSSTGRLESLTPASDPAHPIAPYTFSYDTDGRLASVSQQDPQQANPSVTTIRYNLPISGTTAPVDMSGAAVAAWDQHNLPSTATAVFGPHHVPASPTASSDWPYATLHYLDVNGRETNTAAFGASAWQVDTSEYDAYGNTTRTLAAAARAEALDLSTPQNGDYIGEIAALTPDTGLCGTDSASGLPLCTVERADLLDTQNTYSADGIELLDTLAPLTPVRLDDGSDVAARQHTAMTYDTGAPATGGPYHLLTKTVTTALTPVDGLDHDPRTVTEGYDPIGAGDASGWTLRAATTVTTDMGAGNPALTGTSLYNTDGQLIEARQPSEPNGGGPGTTTFTYYTATGTGDCVNPVLAGLLCSSQPATQPSTGTPLPITRYTYTRLLSADTVTESYGSTGVTRTSTVDYDAADRPTTTSVTVTPTGAGGTAIPDVTTGYDPATGQVHTVNDGTGTTTTSYDTLGRPAGYTDADGNLATTSYDIAGRIASSTDGKGTTSYSYDGTAGEHRSLPTAIDTGMGTNPSQFTGSYDAAGRLVSQTYPNGLVATWHYDESNQIRALSYDKGGVNWFTFTVDAYSNTGQILHQSGPGSEQDYHYDNASRLTRVADIDNTTGVADCTTRIYAYSANSNRTSLTSYPDGGTGCTTATTPALTQYTINNADQLTATTPNGGTAQPYTLDALGRATTVPSVDAGGKGAMTVGYTAGDMVASQSQTFTDDTGLTAGQNLQHTRAWTLDPNGRLRTGTEQRLNNGTPVSFDDAANPANSGGTTAITTLNHYADDGDSPAWIDIADAQGNHSWTRNVPGLDGGLAATQTPTGVVQLQLANIHGDIVATADDTTAATPPNAYSESTEFGVARATASHARYGWLGAHQRSSEDLGGIVLMGVRLYTSSTGRFLQVDPIPGGSANDYDYCNQDPINTVDLDGTMIVRETAGGATAKQAKQMTRAINHYQATHRPPPPPRPEPRPEASPAPPHPSNLHVQRTHHHRQQVQHRRHSTTQSHAHRHSASASSDDHRHLAGGIIVAGTSIAGADLAAAGGEAAAAGSTLVGGGLMLGGVGVVVVGVWVCYHYHLFG
jgi:RHS repeat-associated protein